MMPLTLEKDVAATVNMNVDNLENARPVITTPELWLFVHLGT